MRTRGVLIVYYVGHGLIGRRGDLYLAVGRTDPAPGRLASTAISYDMIRRQLTEDCPAQAIVVILDCCFSSTARTPDGAVDRGLAALTGLEGGLLITSAAREEHALAPEGDRYTAFTGQLLTLLREGDPDGPPELTFRTAYGYLQTELEARRMPTPRWVSAGIADDIVLTSNPAYDPRTIPLTRVPRPASPAPAPSEPTAAPTGYPSTTASSANTISTITGGAAAGGAVTGGAVTGGAVTGGSQADPPPRTRRPWAGKRRVALACVVAVVAAGLIAFLIWPGPRAKPTASSTHHPATNLVACAPGSLQLIGSTAFGPFAQGAADAYIRDCQHVKISITVNGGNSAYNGDSAYGVSQVEAAQSDANRAGSMIAMYDGLPAASFTDGLRPYPLGVLIFSIIAHNGTFAGSNVTTAQLRQIFTGSGEQGYVAVGRRSGSGSRLNLFVKVLRQSPGNPAINCPAQTGQEVSFKSCTAGSTAAALNFVNGTPHSVGYAEIYGTALASNPQVSQISINNITPTTANVLNGSYSYWTVEHLYTGKQVTALATDFLKFLPQYIESSNPADLIECSAATKILESDC